MILFAKAETNRTTTKITALGAFHWWSVKTNQILHNQEGLMQTFCSFQIIFKMSKAKKINLPLQYQLLSLPHTQHCANPP